MPAPGLSFESSFPRFGLLYGLMKLVAALLALCGMGLLASAQSTPPKFFPYPYTTDDLPNQLRLITVPTDNPNLVALYIIVQTGSRNEIEEGKSGYAHFFEHMMFRGSERFTPEERDAILKRGGASVNAYTSDDRTVYHTLFSKEDLDQVMELEADRFQRLKYRSDVYKTESRAILGEYNKNSASPFQKLNEKLRETAFDRHTYKHTTMGFLRDIEDMPNQYEYSLTFYKRYYRPEYTTILLVGDVTRDQALSLTRKHFGDWKPGGYSPDIPAEPTQTEPRQANIDWPSPTLPHVVVAFHGPEYSDVNPDKAALDLLLPVAFGENSDLYQRLVLKEQKVDLLIPSFDDQIDPELFAVYARIKDPKDASDVRDQILATFERFSREPIPQEKLDQTRSRLRYGTALSWDSSEAIAAYLAPYIALRRTPATIDKLFALYGTLTPEDVLKAAAKYFVDQNRTIVTLANKSGDAAAASAPSEEIAAVLLPSRSPLISFRLLFNIGAANDPKGKEGLAALTAAMLAEGGTRALPYEKILEAMYPMAAAFNAQTDKEMTVFSGTTHLDNLEGYYGLIRQMLLEPGFREEDFSRLKTEAINYLKVSLRETNDEELGKERLYNTIYRDHPYGHHNSGTISALEKLTLDDVRGFYRDHYRQGSLVLGLAGAYPDSFPDKVRKDFAVMPDGQIERPPLPEPTLESGMRIEIVQRETRSTALSLGFPIDVVRGDPDWPVLALVTSYFGQHRSSNSHLFQRLREARGLNYGDYAYLEYFPGGMYQFQPDPNLARRQQIFQIWIRPVEPQNGLFTLRAALYEYDKLLREGLSKKAFEGTREFLSKYADVLLQTQDARLGYALDSRFYGIGSFGEYLRGELAKLTLDDVNKALRRHLRPADGMRIVIVTKDAEGLRDAIIANQPSPITYNSPKPQEILDEDKKIAVHPIPVKADSVAIRPVSEIFQ